MGFKLKCFLLFSASTLFLAAATAYAQDEPSLGDVARQQRQQKEKSKNTPGKDIKAPKVITNEEIPEHAVPAGAGKPSDTKAQMAIPSGRDDRAAADVASRIRDLKNQIADQEKRIAEINDSIRYAPGNCVSGCVQWNEQQKEKQEQVQRMQTMLDQMKTRLAEMQESARKAGFGSSVYDP